MTEYMEMEELEFDRPEEREGVFVIDNDRAAGWAMRKIAQANAERDRLLDQINERVEALKTKAQEVTDKAKRETANLEWLLYQYMSTLPQGAVKTTKAGRVSYELPEGRIMMTAPKMDYKRDDVRLMEQLKKANAILYIRTKEEPNWAQIKKNIRVTGDGAVLIVDSLGEIIETDAIQPIQVPGEFKVEVV